MRFIIVALVMVLASSVYPQERGEGGGQGQATTEQQPSKSAPWAFPVDVIEDQAEAEARKAREQRSEQRELDDLAAQQGMNEATQKMADYSLLQTIFLFVDTAALIWTLYLTSRANMAAATAASAATAANKIMLTGQRPWLKLEDIKLALISGGDASPQIAAFTTAPPVRRDSRWISPPHVSRGYIRR